MGDAETRLHMRSILFGITALLLVGSPARAGGDAPPLHEHFLRGDANQDGAVQVADPIYILAYLFTPGSDPITCLDSGDVNDDEAVDLSDAVYSLTYQFGSGPTPPAPFGITGCGPDPTLAIALSCNQYDPCGGDTTSELAAHAMRRLGFGPTPDRLAYVESIGLEQYIEEQLSPELDDEVDNVELQARLSVLDPTSDLGSLLIWQVVQAMYSRNQLRETLTDFWENHFNTDLAIHLNLLNAIDVGSGPVHTPEEALAESVNWEWIENATFRNGSLGTFAELLVASAAGRPMLVYLDSVFNSVVAPNENFARELLELHTMGVDNGYTQQDIEQVARCFTGWTIRRKAPADAGDPLAPPIDFYDPTGVWSFHFQASDHDYDQKVIFPGTSYELVIPTRPMLSPDGWLDGLQVLLHVASLPQTAEFVSTKLIQKFISDEAPPALVAESVGTWLATDGDLRAVIAGILASPEFRAREYRWNKVETAFENLVSALRAIDADTSGVPVIVGVDLPQNGLIGLGQLFFLFATPDGQSELGADWIGSTALLNRILFSSFAVQSNIDPVFDPIGPMVAAGVPLTNAIAVADFWLERLFQTSYDMLERDLAIDYVSQDGDGIPAPLVPGAAEYETRIRAFVGFLLSTPQANKQ